MELEAAHRHGDLGELNLSSACYQISVLSIRLMRSNRMG